MSTEKIYRLFRLWCKITLSTFVGLNALALLLLVLLSVLRVPSFNIGNDALWLLRWQYEQSTGFVIVFNPLILLAIAAVIGFVGVYLRQKSR
ncbi:hypothetical protein [Nostoc parmelioides]|uniref:Uncharacterized protein n=1 Tax=Nostoc parmelioides FACHB-3921 TaxID=2692909 RepID=A0ABR8BJT3_9NOSO|nr:hypothetical protein [Nostoc parmelioides]MBD2254352.1 hypothetical protein [Nostoc parmelioides FACHB-3921]